VTLKVLLAPPFFFKGDFESSSGSPLFKGGGGGIEKLYLIDSIIAIISDKFSHPPNKND
jgi:hypothetical protein